MYHVCIIACKYTYGVKLPYKFTECNIYSTIYMYKNLVRMNCGYALHICFEFGYINGPI